MGGRPSFLRGCDACPAGRDLRSSGIVADPLDECALEVEHAREASVSDAMVFVQVADLVHDVIGHGAIVMGFADAISAFIECDENGSGFVCHCVLRVLWGCCWDKNNAPPDLLVYGGSLPGDLCDQSSAGIA